MGWDDDLLVVEISEAIVFVWVVLLRLATNQDLYNE